MTKDIFGYIPPRPTARTIDKSEAILEIAKQVHDWCNGETDLEEICIDLQQVLKFAWYSADGFDLAKDMESKGYSADSELVEILDDCHWIIRKHVEKAVKQWVKEFQIRPQFQAGHQLTVPADVLREEKDMTGEIVEVHEEKAVYTVRVPELGHKGRDEPGEGTIGRVLKFEDLHDIKHESETINQ